MNAESCVVFRRLRNGFLVEVNSLSMDEKFPIIHGISFDIPGDNMAMERLIEWFYVDLDELMKSDMPIVRGASLTVVELGDLISGAWSEDDYPFILELMAKFHLIKLGELPTLLVSHG